MATIGEHGYIDQEFLEGLVDKDSIIRAGGNLAVIRTMVVSQQMTKVGKLIGFSVHADGTASWGSHSLSVARRVPCAESAGCMGANFAEDGLIIETIGSDPLEAGRRLSEQAKYVREGIDPMVLPRDKETVRVLADMENEGHVFDPRLQPVLHQAMQQVLAAGR